MNTECMKDYLVKEGSQREVRKEGRLPMVGRMMTMGRKEDYQWK